MKTATIILTLVLGLSAHADTYFMVNGKKTNDKVDALKALIINPQSDVVKCENQEITSKGTLRKK